MAVNIYLLYIHVHYILVIKNYVITIYMYLTMPIIIIIIICILCLFILHAVVNKATGTTQSLSVAKESDSEEEIDFGFWEKASPIPGSAEQQMSRTDVKEVDLNLL